MIPNLRDPLVEVTKENTHPADIEKLNNIYGKEKVEEAIKYLTYKKPIKEMPKDENPNFPILYVFRHGQSEDNINMVFSGWRDAKLTKKGEEDANLLADLLESKKIDYIISSDQIRTIKTMEIAMSKNQMAKSLEINMYPNLRERHYGDWQGYSKLEKHLEDPERLSRVRRGWHEAPPNGESLEMIQNRVNYIVDKTIEMMKSERINIAIACSSNSIRPIRKRFENLTEEQTAHLESPTGKDYAAYSIK